MPQDDLLVTLAIYGSLLDAQLARARLASEGIEAHLPEELAAGVMGEHFDGIRLLVSASVAGEAREVLGLGAAPSAHEPIEFEEERCAICRSSYVEPARRSMPLRWLDRVLGGETRRCGVCGHRWRRRAF
jgi:hypothetical protein